MLNRKRVTIKEVAQAAGVSTQTVSRVLNDRLDVSPETRERVRAVITQLGYSPNALARSLIRGRTHTLGVVGYGLSYYGPARVLTGIERRANELGYSLLLSLLREPETNHGEEAFHNLLSRQVDGIIWAVPEIGANRDWVTGQMLRLDLPVVFINTEPVEGLAVAAVDNVRGGWLATRHLLEQGYRSVGIITGPPSWWEAQQRERGWRQAMQEAGYAGDLDRLKAAADWYPSGGANAMQALLERSPEIEAIFACNDPMAAGAMQAARRLGRLSPRDLGVVGYDDVPEAPYYTPPLTTVRQPLAALGGQAVDLLHRQLRAGPDDAAQPPETVWLQPALVVRESSLHP